MVLVSRGSFDFGYLSLLCRLILFIKIRENNPVREGIFRVRKIKPPLRGMIINPTSFGHEYESTCYGY